MKSWLLMAVLLLATTASLAQKKNFTLEKLINLALLPEAAVQEALAKIGFKQAGSDTSILFEKPGKEYAPEKSILLQKSTEKLLLYFNTLNAEEFLQIAAELKRNKFAFAPEKTVLAGVHDLYQKGPVCVWPTVVNEQGRNWYRLQVEFKQLPQPQTIQYMEDLLQLSSHEYLAAVFGPTLVRRDVFYFSEKEVNKCSILFPNTAKQVIIVWKDEVNNRDISLLLFGGQIQAGSVTSAFFRPAEEAQWLSQQGLFVGMPLRQLQEVNGAPLEFFGWESDDPGVVARHNKGKINFKKLGVQLHCLDCNEDRFYSQTPLLNSAVLTKQSRRVYISTLILKAE